MQFRQINIALDTTASIGFHPFEVVDGDTGNVLNVTLTNSGEPILLNDCTLCIVYSSSIGFAMQDQDTGITLGETAGSLSILLDPENYGPGNVSADIQVYSGPNKKVLITSKTFDFRCRSTLVSEAIIRANQAYPPLIAAAREAVEAATAANEAVEALESMRGELNVQADWLEADVSDDAYILHKPYIPSLPEDVEAAPATHASQHGSDGADPVTPAAIGAARVSALTPATLLAASWTGVDAISGETTVSGGTVSVDNAVFKTAVSGAEGTYVFSYDGTIWTLDSVEAALADYGVTLTGTPASGNTVTVTYSVDEPYTYTLAEEGVTAASAVEVLPGLAITADQLEALQTANLQDGGQDTGSITLKVFGEKPEMDIPVRIIVRGDL